MKRWRWIGMVIFLLLSVIEISDLLYQMRGFGSISTYAATAGVSPDVEIVRRVILSISSAGIVAGCMAASYGLFGKEKWFLWFGYTAAGAFSLYGLTQLVTAVVFSNAKMGLVFSSLVYGLLGYISFWLTQKAKKPVYQPAAPKRKK